jgi:hypothetical protein
VYVEVEDYDIEGKVEAGIVPNLANLEACAKACSDQEGIEAGKHCQSATYDPAQKTCTIYTEGIDITKDVEAQSKEKKGIKHLEQICLPGNVDLKINTIGELVYNRILAGRADKTIDAANLGACLLACYTQPVAPGVPCKSGQFFPQLKPTGIKNCVMSKEDRISAPVAFGPLTPRDTRPQYYFGSYTGAALPPAKVKQATAFLAKDLPIPQSDAEKRNVTDSIEWTDWSPCTTAGSLNGKPFSYRFELKCTKQPCARELRACTSLDDGLCHVLISAQGTRHCPYGRITNTDGSSEICNDAIECQL